MNIIQEAIYFIKGHKKELIKKFADPLIFLPVEKPYTIFMAGSPGAGKTEFSHKFNPSQYNYDNNVPIVRIDADEIRNYLPSSLYTGKNVQEVQFATTIGMDKLFDNINHKNQNAIVDTTFSDYYKAKNNIKRSIKHNRKIGIFYIHLEPKTAWYYTKVRRDKDNRLVDINFFVDAYFKAKENCNLIKKEFPNVELNLIDKKISGNKEYPIIAKTKINIENIDNYLKINYNKESLLKILLSQSSK